MVEKGADQRTYTKDNLGGGKGAKLEHTRAKTGRGYSGQARGHTQYAGMYQGEQPGAYPGLVYPGGGRGHNQGRRAWERTE